MNSLRAKLILQRPAFYLIGAQMTKKLTHTIAILFIGASIILFLSWRQGGRPLSSAAADRLLRTAVNDAVHGHTATAYASLQRILSDYPHHHLARFHLANVCARLERPHEVSDCIARLPNEFVGQQFEEAVVLANVLTSFGFFFEAEPLLQRLIVINPDHVAVRKELLRCLRISGQNAAARNLLANALRERRVDLADLLMITAPSRYWASNSDIQFMQRVGHRHNDPMIMLGHARREIESGRLSNAVNLLQQILDKFPNWQPSLTRLAIANWLLGRDYEWQQAMSGWDPVTLNDADAWFVWGVWHRENKQVAIAVRCFSEALLRDPKHVGACSHLITSLKELGLEADSMQLKRCADRLSKLELACIDVGFNMRLDGVIAIAAECDALGLHAESWAWNRYGKQKWDHLAWPEPVDEVDRGTGSGGGGTGMDVTQSVFTFDYHSYPLPTKSVRVLSPVKSNMLTEADTSHWGLDDEATFLGVNFHFSNGLDSNRTRAYMFEFAGPGIGVLDYDRDGWPDLHLTQGAPWPIQEGDTSSRDELFRNMGSGVFAPVAADAGLGEPGYSQGPAVGDLDCDGFPDVYVCNIGPNRCYRNNGDGTFSEVSGTTGMAGNEWSQSAAWADFNGDGLLDLYVVNYLAGDVFIRACIGEDGRPEQCAPTLFPAADDCLFLNCGDGTFQDISTEAGILVPDGKGLGVLVGRLHGSSHLGVFVANDTTANYLFLRKSGHSRIPQFEEKGVLNGVAFGPQGNSQSSMGVAAGDVNGDGLLDLFVTNYVHESSNLYVQRSGGLFEDLAGQFGVSLGGFQTEGWGTQFLDVDADGDLDLFVANGHVEELASKSGLMSPHLFCNRDGKKLELVPNSTLGRYFRGKYLGRSAVVWDWNRDGHEDLCVSHVSVPVAILSNRTQHPGHCLSLRLVGVRASRDPIGTRVKLTSGEQVLVRELVAGDGYAASNERRLYFGLGSATGEVNVEIDWPSGIVQHFPCLAVGADYVLIEGRSAPVQLWRYDATSSAATN